MLNTSSLRSQYSKERHILGLLPSNVSRKHKSSACVFGWACFLAVALFIGGCIAAKPVHAEQVASNKAVLAIIGEAENQDYFGMLAVACAIRNRGTLKGVYGLHAKRVLQHKYSQQTYHLAELAWKRSSNIDITNGATGWGNSGDLIEFGKCKWWTNCKETFRYKAHVFYKEVA